MEAIVILIILGIAFLGSTDRDARLCSLLLGGTWVLYLASWKYGPAHLVYALGGPSVDPTLFWPPVDLLTAAFVGVMLLMRPKWWKGVLIALLFGQVNAHVLYHSGAVGFTVYSYFLDMSFLGQLLCLIAGGGVVDRIGSLLRSFRRRNQLRPLGSQRAQ